MSIIIALIIFPVIIDLIYAISTKQIVNISAGDLLSFYGAALGIFVSFVTYRYEKKKEDIARQKELKPIFQVEVVQDDENKGIFNIKIKKLSEKPLRYAYLYGEYSCDVVESEVSYRVSYNQNDNFEKKYNPDFNICGYDNDLLDKNGIPRYVQILCEDIDGNLWSCSFDKVTDSGKTYYYPKDIELM